LNLYQNQLFHIYNQGNNKRQLFFSDENYKFFLWKMRAYLLPFGDLVGYCLMPNHFHWLFWVKEIEVKRSLLKQHLYNIELQRKKLRYSTVYMAQKINSIEDHKTTTLNNSIGDLLKSYSKAINKQNGWSGSMFRGSCKAKDGWIDKFITVNSRFNQSKFSIENDYAFECLTYIHQNPVKAGIVENPFDWKYSSARDYLGERNGTLCNVELGKKILNYY